MISARVVVVGGGIAGLAAAHRLLELTAARGIPLELTLLEARHRLGGIIATEREGERDRRYLIEVGPDSFLTAKPWGLDLCGRLGLTDGLIGTHPAHRRTFVAYGGRLHPLPDGFALLAPARFGPVMRSHLFTWRGKARMAMDLVLPRRRGVEDESLAQFVRRRFGREVLERVAQPMVAGIYTADPETLSLAATMPRFLDLERRYGSVIRGLVRAADGRGPAARKAASGGADSRVASGGVASRRTAEEISGQRWSLFVAPADGMEALVTALLRRLAGGTLRCGVRVRSIEPSEATAPGDGRQPGFTGHGEGTGTGRYRLVLDDGAVLHADAVIVATEAHQAARLLDRIDPDLSAALGAIPYASSAAVTMAYRRDQIAHALDGFGVVVPHVERRRIIACTFSSVKFAGRAPDGAVLLRAFFGGALHPEVLEEDDRGLAALAERELGDLLGAGGPPQLVRVHRHPLAMPQYLVGHLDRIGAIEARIARHSGLALAGGAYRGVGIPDCIHSGDQAAERILAALPQSQEALGRHE